MSTDTDFNLDEATKQLNALSVLLDTPGWALVRQFWAQYAVAMYEEAANADNSTLMATRLGAHKAVLSLLSWPQRHREQLLADIEAATRK